MNTNSNIPKQQATFCKQGFSGELDSRGKQTRRGPLGSFGLNRNTFGVAGIFGAGDGSASSCAVMEMHSAVDTMYRLAGEKGR